MQCEQGVLRTPSDAQIYIKVIPLGEDGDDQETVQIQALHQQPIVICHDAVLHHHHGDTTPSDSLHRIQQHECDQRQNMIFYTNTYPIKLFKDYQKNMSVYSRNIAISVKTCNCRFL